MKRILAVALMTLFVLGLAATVFADVNINGDMRVRGIWSNNTTDLDSDASDHMNYWDQRLRLGFEAKKGDVQVITRITVSEGTWGQAGPNTGTTAATDNTYGAVKMDNDDLAYMVVPVGPGKLTIGRQHSSWGNKFLTWEAGKDRIKYTQAAGDMTVGAFADKSVEANGPAGTAGMSEDKDTYGVLAIMKSGDMTAGFLLTHQIDQTAAEANGGYIDAYVNTKMDALSIAAEVAYGHGDATKDAADNQKYGGFALASMNMDSLTVVGAAAVAANGYAATKYFTPTNLFGTSQATAISDFNSNADSMTWAVVGAVSIKASDAITAGAKLAYASIEDAATADSTVLEGDLDFAYTISEGVVWSANFAYGKVDVDGMNNEDALMTAAHKLEVKF